MTDPRAAARRLLSILFLALLLAGHDRAGALRRRGPGRRRDAVVGPRPCGRQARGRRHVVRASHPPLQGDAEGDRRRPARRHHHHDRPARQDRALRDLRLPEPRDQDQDGQGLDLPHLLDVEADHRRGDDEAVRRGQVPALRSGREVHPRVARAEGRGQRRSRQQPVLEDAKHPMTIRELMSHTGGLTYGIFSESAGGQDVPRRRRAQSRLDAQGHDRQAGRRSRCASSPGPSGTTASRSTSRATWSRCSRASRSTSTCSSASSGRSA